MTSLFPPRQGEFGSDIPAGDGKLANLFFTVYCLPFPPLNPSCEVWGCGSLRVAHSNVRVMCAEVSGGGGCCVAKCGLPMAISVGGWYGLAISLAYPSREEGVIYLLKWFVPAVTGLKVLSSHLNWGARLDSFDPLLNSRWQAIKKKKIFFWYNPTRGA